MSAPPPAPSVPREELDQRAAAIRVAMERAQVDVVVLTDKKNVEYLTDYQTLSWAYKARPVMAAISAEGLALFGSLTEARCVELAPRHFEPVYYNGYLGEAVTAIAGWVRAALGRSCGRVALDYGPDMFGRGALELMDALSSLSAGGVESASALIWSVRMVKSPLEAERKRVAFDIVNGAFDAAVASARPGITEYELCRFLQAETFLRGAETADPIALLFCRGDYAYGRPPSGRRLKDGDYIWTDFRATYGGYPADRNRIARAGKPAEWEIDTYARTRELTVTLARDVRAGMTCADLYALFEAMWAESGLGPLYSRVSRIGHGGGLDVTEPPSISRNDHTPIVPGMILHLEPKLERNGAVFQFEEVIHVTEGGPNFLSALSPEAIPVVPVKASAEV